MDFWTGQPLESGNKGANSVPAFWSCANKMMAYLLDLSSPPKGLRIGPRSLKVAAIFAIIGEVANAHSNPPNYRSAKITGWPSLPTTWIESILETSPQSNLTRLILDNPRSAQTWNQDLLKLTNLSCRGA